MDKSPDTLKLTLDPLDVPICQDDEDEESEPVESPSSALENFRRQWEDELNKKSNQEQGSKSKENTKVIKQKHQQQSISTTTTANSSANNPTNTNEIHKDEDDLEKRATELFLHAVNMEKVGNMYEACRFYKQAFQLVPDIEKKVSFDMYHHSHHHANPTLENENINTEPSEEDEEEEDIDLRNKFLNCIKENGWIFFTRDNQADNSIHMQDVPEEVLSYIVSWVVGNQLDVRSLDTLSSTCKGFYVVCRDEGLWKEICSRIWGKELTRKLPSGYLSYREMFLTRQHPRFDGCYISKITYVRSGENSFQDQTYRPWYLIDYYRYIRFFATGVALFITTSEAPKDFNFHTLRDPTVGKSRKILKGHYKLSGSTITAQFASTTKSNQSKTSMQYNIEFTISHSKGRHNWILNWNSYDIIITTGMSSVMNQFDIEHTKFPPLMFSRVKCFTTFSQMGLYT